MGTFIYILVTVVAVALPFYALGRWLYCRAKKRGFHAARELPLAAFSLFFTGLLFLVLMVAPARWAPGTMLDTAATRLATGEGINLVPFDTIDEYFKRFDPDQFLVNIVGNLLMFVPVGFGLPLLWRRWQHWWKLLLWAVLMPVGIEFLQLFIGRNVDVDDVLLNALGILAGWGLYLLARRLWPRLGALALPKRSADGRRHKTTPLPGGRQAA